MVLWMQKIYIKALDRVDPVMCSYEIKEVETTRYKELQDRDQLSKKEDAGLSTGGRPLVLCRRVPPKIENYFEVAQVAAARISKSAGDEER